MRKENLAAITIAGLVAMLTAHPLWGGESPATLPDIISLTLTQNAGLKALRAERGLQEAEAVRAGVYPNPVLELEAATGSLTGSSSENAFTVGLSQEVITAGKRGKRLQVANKGLQGFDRSITDRERLLKLEAKTAFYDLLLAQGRAEVARDAEELNKRLLQIAGERFAAGEVAELDVNLARVEAARAEWRRVEAEREFTPARQRLLLLTGSGSSDILQVRGGLDINAVNADLEELKALARKRPDLLLRRDETERAEAQMLVAQAERLPNVTAGVFYSMERSSDLVGGGEEKTTDNLLGVRVTVPIPFFDRNQAALQEARALVSSSGMRAVATRQAVDREVEEAHATLMSAQKSAGILQTGIVSQMKENLKLVQEAYSLGEMGILPVIEEQKKFLEMKDSYLSALYNCSLAVARLEAAVGTELQNKEGGNK